MSKREIHEFTTLEHMADKAMWAGDLGIHDIEVYTLNKEKDIFEQETLAYTPVLYKAIDEIIVNATDHYTHYPKLVNKIEINVLDTGEISVYNNGPGITVDKMKTKSGEMIYIPQLIASKPFTGSNLIDDGNNIKGGTNGVGLKLTGCHSDILTLETVDSENKKKYVQSFKNSLTIIDPPKITVCNNSSYTKVSFLPQYDKFKLNIENFLPILKKLVYRRSYDAAVYTGAKVYFNKTLISISFKDYCQMFTTNQVIEMKMINNVNDYDWDICLAISSGKDQNYSIINGVCTTSGGTHIKHIQNQLVNYLSPFIIKEIKKAGVDVKFNRNYVINNIHIFMKGIIPSPVFVGQVKEEIADKIQKFEKYYFKGDCIKIWDLLKDTILELFLKIKPEIFSFLSSFIYYILCYNSFLKILIGEISYSFL